ncbi:MAG: lipopolysaccharide biosynthesis protein [Desulfobacterales bacterium]|nr:lipopolysaccharide biosynthesis protein [Desulfobacterales bacterium]
MKFIKNRPLVRKIMNPDKSIRERIFSGLFWMYVIVVFQKLLKAFQLVIFARLIAPEHFGVISLATITVGAVNAVSQTGFHMAVVQSRERKDALLNTAWSFSIIRGALIYLALFFIAPYMAVFFSTPELTAVIRVFAVIYIFIGLQNIGVALLTRQMDFRKIARWELWSALSNFCVSAPLALWLRNEWAIVAGVVVSEVVKCVLSYRVHEYRPRVFIGRAETKKLFNFGIWIAGLKLTAYMGDQFDKLVIGRLFGVAPLGLYSMSYRFVELSRNTFGQMAGVVFPAFSRIHHEDGALADAFLPYITLITLAALPLLGFVFTVSDPFIHLFLGEKWLPAAGVLKVLLIGAALNIFSTSSFPLLHAVGNTRASFHIMLINIAVLMILIYPLGKYLGLTGVALAWTMGHCVAFPVCLIRVFKAGNIDYKRVTVFVFPLVCLAVVAATSLFLQSFMEIRNMLHFFFAVAASSMSYIVCVIVARRFFKLEIFDQLAKLKQGFMG